MPRYEDDDGAAFGVRTKARRAGASRTAKRARKPVKRATVSDIVWSEDAARPTTNTEFSDPDMQRLYDRGYFDTLVGQLRGGKEATVFVVRKDARSLVAKLYTDLALRSFQNDAEYWAGFFIGDARTEKAMRKGTRAGHRAKQAIWSFREYQMLWRLHGAGLPVPRPAVGPNVSDLGESGSVVLMELIGDGDRPAPRLSDVRLSPEEARDAWRQSVAIYLRLAELGLVHGDLSTYNLLWHEGRVWLIDVPQTLEIAAARGSLKLLGRDLDSLFTSFRRLGLHAETADVLRTAMGMARAHRGM